MCSVNLAGFRWAERRYLRLHQEIVLRMHVDEFCDSGGGALACELGVETADHAYHTPLECVSHEGSKRQHWISSAHLCDGRSVA